MDTMNAMNTMTTQTWIMIGLVAAIARCPASLPFVLSTPAVPMKT